MGRRRGRSARSRASAESQIARWLGWPPASDSVAGEILWDTRVQGIIQTSTITYAANGRQYVAVLTGEGLSGTSGPMSIVSELKPTRRNNSIYVFALPDGLTQ